MVTTDADLFKINTRKILLQQKNASLESMRGGAR